ncbi:WD repeat-containing protein 6-like [Mizuhopecten yessoensis]|uniref:tRNA (34-2'-O)-methyltransferase regulator WDR6 n=1 Tax=Mizuhopecten yessoensis TaxID=6573 RepID=A0A210PPC9_MIZYE|nr:WD repeat-containing protein 6-like [Mizuhopecten yessoensis]OWF38296.1 WD repeat-containing protein 6 [Mizuhopecten yessoensis]
MMNVGSKYHTGPVTSLCVVKGNIIAGIGNSLYLYDLEERQCILKQAGVIHSGNIHGIRKSLSNDVLLCVFGGKVLRVVGAGKSPGVRTLDPLGEEYMADDWIWDVCWLQQQGQQDQLAVATAHNVVLRLDSTLTKLSQVACVENCILYCAKFLGTCWEHLILAAGTVFNQVLMWAPNGQTNTTGQSLVIHKLIGHQGVIFSIEFSSARRQICTVSDDRSVRVWQLQFPEETEDSDRVISLDWWQQCQSTELFVLYGHSARVWDVKILTSSIVSVGEDSTCCVWDNQGKITQRFKGHKGKSIWSLAVEDTGKFAVTGGGDSSIRLWYMDESKMTDQLVSHVLVPPRQQESDTDFPRIVAMISWDGVITMTNEGRLMLHSQSTRMWTTLMSDVTFTSYSVLSLSPHHTHLVALGNISGTLRLLFTKQSDTTCNVMDLEWCQKDFDVHRGKVYSINWISASSLLTSGPDGEMIYWELGLSSNQVTLQKLCSLELPPCKHRWVSAATMTSDLLVCGDRGGSVHVYCMRTSPSPQSQSSVQTFYRIHGKTCVTHICYHDNYIYSAGRDGTYNQYEVIEDKLVLLHSNKIHKGFDWLDRLDFTCKDRDLLVYGFHSNNFVLWSNQNNQRLVQIPCGGGHRAWDSRIHGNSIRFVYIRTGEVVLCETELSTNQVLLKESLHGREVTDILHLKSYDQGGSPVHIIGTCSEDTQVNLLSLTDNQYGVTELKQLTTLQGHISSIRTLAMCGSGLPWKQPHSERILLFSGGGRAQLLVWRVTIPKPSGLHGNTDLMVDGVSHETLYNYMIDHWNNRNRKPWKGHNLKPNPETRFMDLAVVRVKDVWSLAPPGVHILMAACSDGYVRFYCFDEEVQTLTLLEESAFHDHCVLQVLSMIHHTPDNSSHLVCLSAATDGRVAFWDLNHLVLDFIEKNYHKKVIRDEMKCKCCSEGVESIRPASADKKDDLKVTSERETDLPLQDHCPNMKDHCACPCHKHRNLQSECSTGQGTVHHEHRHDADDNINQRCQGDSSYTGHCNKLKTTAATATRDSLDPVFVISSHQSGVNSLHICKLTDCQYMVGSGGDDNALGLSNITMATNKVTSHLEVTTNWSVLKENAHSAQITGLHILGERRAVTASVDQRVCVWDISTETGKLPQIQLVWCKFVQVSDISSMTVWISDRLNILTAGVGLEMLSAAMNDEVEDSSQ